MKLTRNEAVMTLLDLKDLCQEVWDAHRDPDDAEYNECEHSECAWCQHTKENVRKLSDYLLDR